MMKKICFWLIIGFVFILSVNNVDAVQKVDANLKVYDYGEFLTPEEEVEIKALIDDYIEQNDMDMVIVTQNDYQGNLSDYGDDFYDYNDFGVGKTNDGILLVFNVDSLGPIVEIITTGEGIIMYDDERIDELRNSMSNVKSQGNATMIKAFINKANLLASFGIPDSNRDMYIDSDGNYRHKKSYPWVCFIIFSAAIATIVLLVMKSKNKMIKKASDAQDYLDRNSVIINNRQDRFVNTFTTRVSLSNGSGGSSGGSSIHSGSSGISHGGGGGRL